MIIKMADDFSVIDQESQDENVASCYQVETNLYDKGGQLNNFVDIPAVLPIFFHKTMQMLCKYIQMRFNHL